MSGDWCPGSGARLRELTTKRVGNTPIIDRGKCPTCGRSLKATLDNRSRNHKPPVRPASPVFKPVDMGNGRFGVEFTGIVSVPEGTDPLSVISGLRDVIDDGSLEPGLQWKLEDIGLWLSEGDDEK